MSVLTSLLLPALLAVYAAVSLVRPAISPLWTIPGPRISSFTPLVLRWNEFRGRRTRYIHQLHLVYGPVVRVAPREVSFTSETAIKEIYRSGGSGYDKTDFYNLFTGPTLGSRTMFTLLQKDDHGKRKRDIADAYSNSNIMKPHVLDGITMRARKFVQNSQASSGMPLDIFTYLHAYACDCITHHLFHPYGSNCLEDEHDREMMHQVASDDSLQNRLIHHWSPVLHKITSAILPFFAKPRETPLADEFVLRATEKADPAAFTLLARLRAKKGWQHRDRAAECLDHMAAGIDTTGASLCFTMWQLSQPESLHSQTLLYDEFATNPDSPFDKLPYLDAVVMEGLRCFPAIPMSLPRYVPSGGRVVDGHFLSAGTVASSQAYSVHHSNEAVFPNPDVFRPERWLEPDGQAADRDRLMFAFSSGGRGCVGKHLALAETKILLREVYSKFITLPDESMTAKEMEMSDQLISSRPAGQRCLLKLVPRAPVTIAS